MDEAAGKRKRIVLREKPHYGSGFEEE